MSNISIESIQEAVQQKFGSISLQWDLLGSMWCCTIPATHNYEVIQYLQSTLGFQFLTDLTAVHYPERIGEEFCIVTHLHNLIDNFRLRIKSYVSVEQPNITSLVPIFPGANWMERETYDFFGIQFEGHPDLRRILNADEMDYHPMRKEYPMEDPTRRDKDDEMFGRG